MIGRPATHGAVSKEKAKLPLTVILCVLNEEENLPEALASVNWADRVVVVDSRSTDRTAEIADQFGAELVQFDYSGSGPKKQQWVLENLEFRTDWVLYLAADERITPALRAEIERTLEKGTADGYCIDREFVFMGRSMRCFRPNWNLRLFKHRLSHWENLGLNDLPGTGDIEVHEHIVLDGRIGFLQSALLHDDDRGITPWLDRHNKYATWEAHLYRKFRNEPVGMGPLGLLRLDPFRRKRVLRRIWVRLPMRPALRFLVWYLLRRGILDGRPGFVFCVLMAF
jgi:glycosyltransferase involved in cell wall biosynthesis